MSTYEHKRIEERWQKHWEENETFRMEENSDKEKLPPVGERACYWSSLRLS